MKIVRVFLKTLFVTILFFVSNVTAQRVEIVRFPLIPVRQDSVSVISWLPLGQTIDSNVRMRFGSSPGGGILSNYPNSAPQAVFDVVNGLPSLRIIPSQIRNNNNIRTMPAGIYHYVLYTQIGNSTIVSEERTLIVESENPVVLLAPITAGNNSITETVPTFSWQANPGVPYYHIILSDKPIEINIETQSISGISVVWQAITASTSIQYGTADPSGEFAAQIPPPLCGEKTYNWIVLNNYGNKSIFSSPLIGAPASFRIGSGISLAKPTNIFPENGASLNSTQNSNIDFRWSSAGEGTLAYEIYLFTIDSIFGIETRVNVWQATTTDTFLTMTASGVLHDNRYSWEVHAIDAAGSSIASNFTNFNYQAGVANLRINTFTLSGNTPTPLPLVFLEVISLAGSTNIIPFGTNASGTMPPRALLPGDYRIVASKDGYATKEEIISIQEIGRTYTFDIFLEPAIASVFGKVLAQETSLGINQATVTLTGPGNKRVTVLTTTNGAYSTDIPIEGVWTIQVEKPGYIASQARAFSVLRGENLNAGNTFLSQNRHRIMGTITNAAGVPISRATVSVVRADDNFLYNQATTNNSGIFTFFVEYGNWTLLASAAGYASQTVTIDRLTSTNEFNITLVKGGQIIGTTFRQDYNVLRQSFDAITPLANAVVTAVETTTGQATTTIANTFGRYALNVGHGTYRLSASITGYRDTTLYGYITISPTARTVSGQNIVLTSMGKIGGFTRSSVDSLPLGNISISATNANLTRVFSVSNRDGYFEFSSLEDGEYVVSAVARGFSMSPVETVTIQSGIPSRLVELYLEPSAFYSAEFTVRTPENAPTVLGNLFISSPINISARKTTTSFIVDSLSAGIWTYKYFPDSPSIIGVEEASFSVAPQSASPINITVHLPFSHISVDTIRNVSPLNLRVPIELSVADNRQYTVILHYRQSRNVPFRQQPMTRNSNRFIAEIELASTGVSLEYYFVCTSIEDEIVYSNRNSPFFSYIPTIARLEYTAFAPFLGTVSQPKTVLRGHSIRVNVEAYYKGRVYPELISSTQWLSSDPSAVSFTTSITEGSNKNTLHINKVTTTPVVITAISIGIHGTSDTLHTALNIIDGRIIDAFIARTDKQVDDKTLSNRAIGSFVVIGNIETPAGQTKTLQLPAIWHLQPSSAATMVNNNLIVNDDFAGQLKISAVVQGHPRVHYNNDESVRYKNRFLHIYSPVNERDTIKNYRGLSLVFPENSFINPGTDKLFIRETKMGTYQKIAEKYEVIGNIYIFSMDNHSEFNESIIFNYELPLELRGRNSYALGLYNDSLMAFEIVKRDIEITENNIFTARLDHFSTYAIMAEREPISIKNVVFSPNPFSPFVYARDNDGRYRGLGIRFYCSTINDPAPDIRIEIFTTEGVKVWEQRGGANITSGYQEFSWDGYTSDGTMARNGRYIVKITAEEKSTGQKVVYKGVVVLIK